MSIDELSETLRLSTAFVGLIERGQRGAKLANLMKIADIFGITVNDLIYPKSGALQVREEWAGGDASIETLRQQKKDAIMSLAYDFTVEELEFIIGAIKSLRVLKRANSKKENYVDAEDGDDEDGPVNY